MQDLKKKIVNTTPVFQRNLAAYNSTYPIICNEGGSRCFYSGQEVKTKRGNIPISQIKPGDIVLTYNEKDLVNEWKPVSFLHEMQNHKPSLEIKMKDGTIIKVTEDHKFYYEGEWVCVKHIVSLWHERNLGKNRKVQ